MAREHRVRWCVAIAVAIVEAGIWTASTARGSADLVLAAVSVQLASVLVIALPQPRRRMLAAAVSAAVPVVGPIAAILAVTVRGNGGRDLLHDAHAETGRVDAHHVARSLVTEMPACDALSSSDRQVRWACLAKLAGRANASDLALLRWARTRTPGDIAVEIALALEDIVVRFESRAYAARESAARGLDYETRAGAFRVLVDGIHRGIVDEPAIARLANEARQHHEAAIAADPDRARELLADRARLELAVDRPEVALDMLTSSLAGDASLIELYKQAAYAARRFELTGELTFRRQRARARV
jgi:hypothetical protein